MSIADTMAAYTLMQLVHGSVRISKKGVYTPEFEAHDGYSYVVAHANTGLRYVVVATPLPKVAQADEGGDTLVTLLQPFQGAWVLNGGYLTMGYIAEKFSPPYGDWGSWGLEHLACITRTIALALGAYDDVDLVSQGGVEG